jgi:hypothetical protein
VYSNEHEASIRELRTRAGISPAEHPEPPRGVHVQLLVVVRHAHKPGGGGNCTSRRVAPVLDSIFTGAHVVGTGLAIGASDEGYESDDAPISRGADLASRTT